VTAPGPRPALGRRVFVLAFVLGAAVPGRAGGAPASGDAGEARTSSTGGGRVLSLAAVRSLAFAQHPDLAAGEARVRAAEASIDVAKSGRRPRIGADVNASAGPGGQIVEFQGIRVSGAPALQDDGAFSLVGRWNAEVGLDWNIYDFGRTSAATRAARWERRAREAQRAATADALVRAVDRAYLDWLDASERARFRIAAAERAERHLARLEARRAAGAAAESALWPARTELASRALEVAEAEQIRDEARLSLEAVAGVELPPNARPDRALLALSAPAPETPPDDPAAAALTARARAAEAEAKKHDNARNPRFTGRVQAGLRGQETAVFPTYRVGLGFAIPVWEGGENAARAQEARARARALRAEREAAEAEHARTVDRNELGLQAAQRRVELAEALLDVAEGRLRDARSRAEGAPDRAEALDQAEATRDRAAQALLAARIDRAYATLRLAAAKP